MKHLIRLKQMKGKTAGIKWTIIAALIACLWTFPLSTSMAAGKPLQTAKIHFQNGAVTTTVIEQNGYQLVPASLFRQLGAVVEWNTADRSAIVSKGVHKVKHPVGTKNAYYTSSASHSWSMDRNLNTRTTLMNGTSYIPLAYTAQKLGIAVEYDSKLKAARLNASILQQQSANSLSTGHKRLISNEDLYWLNRITEAESGGESYEGRIAVAATVLNRTTSDDWPDSVKDTVFQVVKVNGKEYYQFEPVLNKWIYEVTPSEETKRAVQEALNGNDPTNGAVVFYNPKKTSNAWILSRPITTTIGNHVFAQ